MLRSKTDNDGQKIADRGNKVLSMDAVKLLKTQDAGYLAVAAQKTRNERLKLSQAYNLQFSNDPSENLRLWKDKTSKFDGGRVVFVDGKGAQADYRNIKMDDHALDLDQFNEEDIPSERVLKYGLDRKRIEQRDQMKKRKRQQEKRANRLEELERQEKEIAAAQRELSLQRARMNSTIGGITKAGKRWKIRERKK